MSKADHYAQEKLFDAVSCLATGLEPLQKRLADAALSMHTLAADDFPDSETTRIFQGIFEDLTIIEAGPGDDTTKRLTDHDARAIARRIFGLYVKIIKDMSRA